MLFFLSPQHSKKTALTCRTKSNKLYKDDIKHSRIRHKTVSSFWTRNLYEQLRKKNTLDTIMLITPTLTTKTTKKDKTRFTKFNMLRSLKPGGPPPTPPNSFCYRGETLRVTLPATIRGYDTVYVFTRDTFRRRYQVPPPPPPRRSSTLLCRYHNIRASIAQKCIQARRLFTLFSRDRTNVYATQVLGRVMRNARERIRRCGEQTALAAEIRMTTDGRPRGRHGNIIKRRRLHRPAAGITRRVVENDYSGIALGKYPSPTKQIYVILFFYVKKNRNTVCFDVTAYAIIYICTVRHKRTTYYY